MSNYFDFGTRVRFIGEETKKPYDVDTSLGSVVESQFGKSDWTLVRWDNIIGYFVHDSDDLEQVMAGSCYKGVADFSSMNVMVPAYLATKLTRQQAARTRDDASDDVYWGWYQELELADLRWQTREVD